MCAKSIKLVKVQQQLSRLIEMVHIQKMTVKAEQRLVYLVV